MPLTFALQALLHRHEAYMAEAEEERKKMGACIERLEGEKRELEAENKKTIEENRYLLDQLEDINNRVVDCDTQILSLNNTLLSTRKELERLNVLAAQTTQLEAELANFEREQEVLQHQLVNKGKDERTAVQRWKGAERTIGTLQEQVDRIEREAVEERVRHTEVVARFERRRAVERELEGAAGRLKGAAAATTLEKNGSNTVVSHFVKDILQDNAKLQLGIVELREMLMGSNQEVENLRQQMMLHQPVQPRPDGPQRVVSLSSELAKTATNEALQDFHVHHHYHAAPTVETKKKGPSVRRPKKLRNSTSPGLRTPSSGAQTPRTMPTSPYMRATPPSAAATILSQTSVTIPPPSDQSHWRQWSMQSSQPPSSTAASSLPSSPQSAFGSLSLFDALDDAQDSSRPTTPGSTTFGSPTVGPRQYKRSSDALIRSLPAHAGASIPQSISSVLHDAGTNANDEDVDANAFPLLEHSTILEEPEEDSTTRPSTKDSGLDDFVADHFTSIQNMRPRLHRANSHDSILSTRNVDIPKLRSKGSQLLTSQGFTPRTSLGSSSASVGPVTSSTSAIVQPSRTARGYDSSNYNRLLLGNTSASTASTEPAPTEKSKLGKRVGGWMFGKWGNMPTASTGNLKAKDVLSAVGERAKEGKKVENRQSTHIEPVNLDGSLLKESLGETFQGRSFGI